MMEGVLVDTSVWVDHFRKRSAALVNLLDADMALVHPMVIGELACGSPPEPRAQTLRELSSLRQVQQVGLGEVIGFIERESLHGIGCGLVDMILLASTLVTPGAELWTLDKRLARLANRFGRLYHPAAHPRS